LLKRLTSENQAHFERNNITIPNPRSSTQNLAGISTTITSAILRCRNNAKVAKLADAPD
jgi:hypothetical protein